MRTAYTLDAPRPRRSGDVAPWLEVAAWVFAFALLLAAPCAPEPPAQGAARRGDPAGVSGPRGDAPRPR